VRVIALLRGLMVAPARGPPRVHRGSTAGPGGGCRGAKTAGATPTTGCATPPGGVGVERRTEIYLIVAPSLRNENDLVPRAEIGGFSPYSADRSRFGATERQSGKFLCVAPLPHHLGGWHTRWLGSYPRSWPPGSPPRDPRWTPRGRHHEAT
jgi:hypothetical protein